MAMQLEERGFFKLTNRMRYLLFTSFVLFCVLVLVLVGYLNNKALTDSAHLLEENVRMQLLSTALAAREIIDPAVFESYKLNGLLINSQYQKEQAKLRSLAVNSGAKYIYALRMIDGEPNFVFDTDVEAEPFTVYEIASVHEDAFEGKNSAGVSNMVDEYGSFSCGAVPIKRNGEVIGIVAVDIEDEMIKKHQASARSNFYILIGTLAFILIAMSILTYIMLGRVKKMQDHLKHMANYDKLTKLPNRQYLMEDLAWRTTKGKKEPFALLFVDLDNFKSVNDNAGHDAGDALLQNIGQYLDHAQSNSTTFRPGAGMLNIAARIGGDEFVLVAPGISTSEAAAEFAKELLAGFRTNEIDRYVEKYNVGLSIGVALFPYHTDNYNVLIKYADIAMYHAKNSGKNAFFVYNDEMQAKEEK